MAGMSADSPRGTGPGSPDGSVDPQVSRWYDAEAGPVVRPYAMTRGRTSSASRHRLDLIALVVPEPAADDPGRDQTLAPEHVAIVELCSDMPQSIAELAAELDLPVGVVRVLVGDLVEDELVHVTRPVPCGRAAGREHSSRGYQWPSGALVAESSGTSSPSP